MYSPSSHMFCTHGKIFLTTIGVCAVIASPVYSADMHQEIDHLLLFVERTECQYERNGKIHSGREAVEHIKTKYRYFKDDIDSAEKFIELSATKSTMSGKYYLVYCPGRPPLTSQDWLLEELNTYRTEVLE